MSVSLTAISVQQRGVDKERETPESNSNRNSITGNNQQITVVLTKKECPFCDKTYGSFQKTRQHVCRYHNKEVGPRSANWHSIFGDIAVHAYNHKNLNRYKKAGAMIVVKFACISCRNVFDRKSDLAKHVDSVHVIKKTSIEQLSSAGNNWMVQGQDFSLKFNLFRRMCQEKAAAATMFTIEDSFNELLSLSGVLVLQKRCNYHSLPTQIFPPELLQAMRADMINKCQRNSFDPQLFLRLKRIIQQYVDDEMDETRTKIELLTICEQGNEYEQSAINAETALIPFLYDCNMKPMSEMHLTASYIHPFVHGLLSSKMPTKVAHCANMIADELPDTNNRPDYKIYIYSPGYEYQFTNVYGEVKPNATISPTLLVNDFYRLGIFCKDAIDKFNLEQILAFQAVGSCITFFVMTLAYPQLYTFTELIRFHIPTKKADFLEMIGYLDNLIFISSIHKNYCARSTAKLSHLACPTLSWAYFESLKHNLAPRKRPFALTLER
ncbi:hypothetical protein G6F46_005590 [Rhizopus delemar]|uniref:C2H2-type domain-containing protein n=3 Tax=Rhizopus TaxID=4842 RepID=I1BJF7_RHIO9|nr:hypothetical protein RO3G_01041 [Rhizopus delemar RA 99-880]KAG1458557.1 hypothetical protein G6F55_005275 [Rhizopus delemar]KAG1536592.1 hypothetical protein G6F51_010882 [Rhizopus arrhizus]KAG1498730.1 hypothetical protein G6F54_004875 [Rhizopus delemar]KAG1507361.1 hypothetical protein G6F52_011650 [Rhizopus delemar]|eukprot:EIE76337.1 hypothetical protein RO3G_01041 [Rhizopus delemar RA 99-880]